MATIRVSNVTKTFREPDGSERLVLDGIDLDVEEGSFVALVGPSGCGKTTLLNIISGIEPATSGRIEIVTEDGAEPRLGYVFQSARLLPWLSIRENLYFVHAGGLTQQVKERVARYLEVVGLADVAEKFPYQLSGGMQQRAGIARALSIEPHVLLMDEPFSHLDAITAERLREHTLRIWLQFRRTVLFVTHDISEAVQMADRVVVLATGGHIREDVRLDLPRPRDLSDPKVALTYADVVGRFRRAQRTQDESFELLSSSTTARSG